METMTSGQRSRKSQAGTNAAWNGWILPFPSPARVACTEDPKAPERRDRREGKGASAACRAFTLPPSPAPSLPRLQVPGLPAPAPGGRQAPPQPVDRAAHAQRQLPGARGEPDLRVCASGSWGRPSSDPKCAQVAPWTVAQPGGP